MQYKRLIRPLPSTNSQSKIARTGVANCIYWGVAKWLKAAVFDAAIRREFESLLPSQKIEG